VAKLESAEPVDARLSRDHGAGNHGTLGIGRPRSRCGHDHPGR
jgi:hypothetical protein